MTTQSSREIFFNIHSDLPREGPGDAKSTRRAFEMLPAAKTLTRILDIGSGPGMQTVDLASMSNASIVAIDTHRDFLNRARSVAADTNLSHRVQPVQASMTALPFLPQSFDAVWAEGSVFIMGFEQGLRQWRAVLRDEGYVALTEVAWLYSDVPTKPRAFWSKNYPAMTTIAGNINIIHACGYELIGHFTLPESSWWNHYYGPMENEPDPIRWTG